MELIYTTRTAGFEQGKQYRNPQFFDRPEPAKSVVLEGDFPHVQRAYEAAGVKVTHVGKSEPELEPKPEPKPKPAASKKAKK